MSRVFVAGCGFSGLAVARLFHRSGWAVIGGTHSRESASSLQGEPFRVLSVDICDRALLGSAAELQGMDVVIHCASSGRGGVDQYRAVYLEGTRNLAEVLAPKKLVFTSSTSVYAQVGGEWVDEESAAAPPRETGQVLLETERFVCALGGVAARLAGIYGPGRSVLLRKFFSGDARIEGDGLRWINQVHRDDIASALYCLVAQGAQGVFNVNDDEPLPQREIYAWLGTRFRKALPPVGPIDYDRKRGWTNKRVSNAKLRGLGWEPQFPSFFDAIEQDIGLVEGA